MFKKVISVMLTFLFLFLACQVPVFAYTDHLTNNNSVGYSYNISDANIAWVKQANGTLIWVTETDTRSDDEIIAQVKNLDASIKEENAVLRGLGTALTPNKNGSQATITVSTIDGKTFFKIDGKYSHFVADFLTDESESESGITNPPVVEGEKIQIRIDTPLKMAVSFEDGSVYYGGEMKEVAFNTEYRFQMCTVNWNNGIFDNENGLRGSVVYKMEAVHNNDFKELARVAKEDPERYTVKGIDIIDNINKKIIIDGDSQDVHLETDVNNFFVAYRFHFNGEDYNKKTQIENVVNTPVESLSVNLPVGSTVICNAYVNGEKVGMDKLFVTTNSGTGIYEDEFLTSVNDYTWNY